jgi:outer membrane protein TolC
MSLFPVRIAGLAAIVSAACGCVTWPGAPAATRFDPEGGSNHTDGLPDPPPIIQAAHREPSQAAQPAAAAEAPPAGRPLEGLATLTPDEAVRVVLERSPTLEQMRAAAAAAAARFPQVTSLDDPMFGFWTAPGSAGSPNANYAARVELSQKLPYPGKLGLKGAAARAETAASVEDIEDVRQQLAEAARSAQADYFLAVKATGVAEENAKLLREFRQNAEARYKTGQGQQQDVLQADVEIGRQDERLIALRRARQVAVARLNTLMHLPPDNPLPPPADAAAPPPLPDVEKLRTTATGRPDVRAAVARVSAEEANFALAVREYNPDFELMAAYDGFWQGAGGRPLQWQVGLRTNLPVRYGRLSAAVDEARANVARQRAELARLTDRVNFEVQEAFERTREANEVVRLYEAKVLPAAEANVKEAQSAYVTGRVPFLNLIEAQRNRVALKDRYYEALAESTRRRAALERAVGSPLVTPER